MKRMIELELSVFAPTVRMEVNIPPDCDDTKGYINELLDEMLSNKFRDSAAWKFAK